MGNFQITAQNYTKLKNSLAMRTVVNILKYLFFLAIALFLAWRSIADVDINETWHKIEHAHFLILLPTFIILMLSHWIRAIRWNLIIHSIGYKPRTWHSFLTLLLGYFANLLIPRLGEVLRSTSLSQRAKIPLDKLIGTVIVERMIDLLGLIIISLLAFLLQIERIGDFFNGFISKLPLQKILLFGLGALLALGIMAILLWRFKNHRLVAKLLDLLTNVWNGIIAIRKLSKGAIYRFILHTVLIWLGYFLAIFLGCQALDETQSLYFIPSLSILVTGSIGMIVTQGGVGAYPLLVAETTSWYGISAVGGVALGWLLWSSQVIMTILAGLVAAMLVLGSGWKKHSYDSKFS